MSQSAKISTYETPTPTLKQLMIFMLCALIACLLSMRSLAATAPVIDLRPAAPIALSSEDKTEPTKTDTQVNSKTALDNTKTTLGNAKTAVTEPTANKGVQFTTEPKVNSPSFKSSNQCAKGTTDRWQKNLIVTAFKRTQPNQSNAGQLYQVDTLFPQLISDQLFSLHSIVEPAFVTESLPQTSQYNQHQIAEINQKLAQDQHSQLVLAGEILDMSMAHPNATYNPNLYNRVLNQFLESIEVKNRFEKRDRLFHFRVHLVDGITGEYIYSQEYRTYGLWTLTGEVGFGSEKFWQTDYGKQIAGLVKKATKDLSEVIQCQPLKSTVEARPGQTQIVLQSGANNGLHVGDTLSLYQVVMQPSETAYQQSEKRLINRNTTVEVREIYPSHAVAMVKGTTYLSGEFLAVAQ